MCDIFGNQCLEFQDNRKKIVISENRSIYEGNNISDTIFCNYKVDGCLIGEGEKKCDF